MEKERIIIYPVDSEFIPFLKYTDLLEGKEIIGYYAPKGWFYVNKEINLSDGSSIVIHSIDECTDYSLFDTLWLVNSNSDIDFSSLIIPIIKQAAKEKKNIRITRSLSNKEYTLCSAVCEQYDSLLTKDELVDVSDDVSPRILKIQIPVVFVFGMFEHTDKLDTTLYLHKAVKKAGYNVKTILTRINEAEINDCISFPSFMYDKRYSDTDKIIYFNHYLRRIELENKPDIIIVSLPGEIMPLDEIHNGNFGVMPYLISNAVRCDYAVFKLYHNFYDLAFAKQLHEICINKFAIDINSFALSNIILDASISVPELKFYYSSQKPDGLDKSYYFDYVNGDGESLCDNLLNALQDLGNYRTI